MKKNPFGKTKNVNRETLVRRNSAKYILNDFDNGINKIVKFQHTNNIGFFLKIMEDNSDYCYFVDYGKNKILHSPLERFIIIEKA